MSGIKNIKKQVFVTMKSEAITKISIIHY